MIKQYIPLYNLLTEDEKTLFENTDAGKKLSAKIIQRNTHQPFRMSNAPGNRYSVHFQASQKIHKYIAENSSLFIQLKAQIISKFFPGIKLADNELNYLSSCDYSKSILTYVDESFTSRWIVKFFSDGSPEAQAIKIKISNQYDKYFGFLLKEERSSEELLDIALKSEKSEGNSLKQTIRSEWPTTSSSYQQALKGIEAGLGDLFKHPINRTKKYMDDLARTHMVFRFLGLSSENMVLGIGFEGVPRPYMNIFDYYNYHQNREAVGAGVAILQTLAIPFQLIFSEYAHIALFEKNPLSICFRAFFPFLVMGIILSCAYTVLLPLAGHVFIEYLLFIPTLYLSIAAAGVCVQYKNRTHTAMLEWWYGGLYMAPKFQSIQRIQSAFSNDMELSHDVAKYYANSLEECDRIEQEYAPKLGKLTSDEILDRKANQEFKSALYLEWYDLHDREDLGINVIPDIVLERLRSDHSRLGQKIKTKSEEWTRTKKQFFCDKPLFRKEFNQLKQFLFDNESLESNVKKYINDLDGTEHQEIRLDAVF